MSHMESLTQCLTDSLDGLDLGTMLFIQNLRTHWHEVVGPNIAEHTDLQDIQPPVVTVMAYNSMWMQELTMRKPQILAAINRFYKKTIITDLKVIMHKQSIVKDQSHTSHMMETVMKKAETIDFDAIELDPAIIAQIDANLVGITNEKLRVIGREAQIRNYKKNIYMQQHGYQRCEHCDRWLTESVQVYQLSNGMEVCGACRHELYRKHIHRLKVLLNKKPYIVYEEAVKEVISSLDAFIQARQELLYYHLDKVMKGSTDLKDLWMMAMIITHKNRDQLTEEFVVNLGKKYRRDYMIRTRQLIKNDKGEYVHNPNWT